MREFARLLAQIDPASHRALGPEWHDLEDAQLAHSTRLEVEVSIAGRGQWAVAVPVFVSASPLLVAFTDLDALGSYDRGGRAIATLFGSGDLDKIGLLWREAWELADPNNLSDAIRLAREREVTDDPLAGIAAHGTVHGTAKLSDRSLHTQRRPSAATGAPRPRQPVTAPRRLRSIEDIDTSHLSIRLRNDEAPRGTTLAPQARPLTPVAEITGGSSRGPIAAADDGHAPRAYTDRERETFGFEVLAKALACVAPSLSTSGETLTIEESMNLEGENGVRRNVGDEHEWSWSCG